MGKPWWNATPAQRERIVTEFRGLLVRIYSNAIDAYRGQTMQVLPVRMAAGATRPEATARRGFKRSAGRSTKVHDSRAQR